VERAEPARGRLPIVALTAFAMPGDRQRCLDNGMDDHMSKPFTIAELKDVLDRHGGKRAPTAGVPAVAPPGGRRPA
jgi:CheY-like chemotaxis protein